MTLLFDPIPLWKSSDTASSEVATVATLIGGAGKGDALPELIAVSDVASVFGRSERTIRRWIAKGSLPALTVGRSLLVRSGRRSRPHCRRHVPSSIQAPNTVEERCRGRPRQTLRFLKSTSLRLKSLS